MVSTALLSLLVSAPWSAQAADTWSVASAVRNLAYSDTLATPGRLEGLVTWAPPSDPNLQGSPITRYSVYIASDEHGSNPGLLWDIDSEYYHIHYGSNQLNVWHNTNRLYKAGHPAYWLFVRSFHPKLGLQPTAVAAKMILYDHTLQLPHSLSLASASFVDEDSQGYRIRGSLQWVPAAGADLGFTTHYTIHLADDARGAGLEPQLHDAKLPVGTNKLAIPSGTPSGFKRYLLIYANNPNGRTLLRSLLFEDVGRTPVTALPTVTTVTETRTQTTTTTKAPPRVTQLVFIDTNMEAGQIGGAVVSWVPPNDVSEVQHYQVFVSHDKTGSYKARLWFMDPETGTYGMNFPVGTNRFHLYSPTSRRTTNAAFPANWIFVFAATGSAVPTPNALVATRLYDRSVAAPDQVDLQVDSADTHPTLMGIQGTVKWTPAPRADLGLTTHYALYLSGSVESSGSSRTFLATVDVGTHEFTLPLGRYCERGAKFLVLYARNPAGDAASASAWHELHACTYTTTLTSRTVTTREGETSTSATTRTTRTQTTTTQTQTITSVTTRSWSVAQLTFQDTNPRPYQIGGAIVQWVPPADASGVTDYQVYLAADALGSHKVRLWYANPHDADDFSDVFPVGRDSFHLYDPTRRQTSSASHPATWLLVMTHGPAGLQSIEEAAKIPIYDLSGGVPEQPNLVISFIDMDPADHLLRGSLRWRVKGFPDLAFASRYDIFLAEDSVGTDREFLQSVPIGTNEIAIPLGTECWSLNHVLVYACNQNGRAHVASWKTLAGCNTPRPTTTNTGTTITASTHTLSTSTVTTGTTLSTTATQTSTISPTAITCLTFHDTNPESMQIGGAKIEWMPPANTDGMSSYQVFLASDDHGSHRARLWFRDPVADVDSDVFPVGTNSFSLYQPTKRQTVSSTHPATWLLVFAVGPTGLQSIDEAAKVPLYDHSFSKPNKLALTVSFKDEDPLNHRISGIVRWVSGSQEDLGFTTEYELCLSRAADGIDEEERLGLVPMGTNELRLPLGTECWDKNQLRVYARNPNGRATSASAVLLYGCTTPRPTTTTTATTVSATTTISTTSSSTKTTRTTTLTAAPPITTTTPPQTPQAAISPPGVSNLFFQDMNPAAYQIGSAIVEWTPPSNVSEIISYQVFMASDKAGSNRVRLWHSSSSQEPSPVFPVGTNRFSISNPTERQTTSPTHPANWILVFTESAGGLQSADNAAAVRLYDKSPGPPSKLDLTIGVLDSDNRDGYVKGGIFWILAETVDLGFTMEFKIYLAENDSGKNELAIGTVPADTNYLPVLESLACWQRNHVLIYASNPSGRAVQPASKVVQGCGRRLATFDGSSEGIAGNVLRFNATPLPIHKPDARNTTTNLLARRYNPCREPGGCVLV